MKSILFRILLGFMLFVLSDRGFAIPADFSSPQPTFGDADRDGTFMMSRTVRWVDFGNGLRLPVRWVYHSSNQATSPYGWNGFSCTILETNAVFVNSTQYLVTLPCGKQLYFQWQPSTISGGVVTTNWKSQDGQWTGVQPITSGHYGNFTVTRWDGWQLVFNPTGQILSLTTDLGRTLAWQYDSTDGRLVTQVTEPATGTVGVQVNISSDATVMAGSSAARGAGSITINGDTYNFAYANLTLSQIQYPDGDKVQWSLTSVCSGSASRLTYTNTNGRWKSWVFNNANRYLKTDDVWDYTIAGGATDIDGIVTTRPGMSRERIATGETESVGFSPDNSITTSTDVLGNVTTNYSYQSVGVTNGLSYRTDRQRPGESAPTTVWRAVYDPDSGNVVSTYDQYGNETDYSYELYSGASVFQPPQKTIVTSPLGLTGSFEYDLQGNVIQTTSGAGIVRNFEWDSQHRLTEVTDGSSNQLAKYVYYNDTGAVSQVYDACNNEIVSEYTMHLGAPQLKKVTTPEGRALRYERDCKGNITKITSPSGSQMKMTFGSQDNVQKISNSNGAQVSFQYNGNMNVSSSTDALVNSTNYEYDDLQMTSEVTDALGNTTSSEHDGAGDMSTLTDARSNVYSQAFDRPGLRKQLQWPDGTKATGTFDENGRLTGSSARGGAATASFVYDNDSNLTGGNWSYGAYSGSSVFSYSGSSGELTDAYASILGATVHKALAYDSDGRLSTLTQTIGEVSRSASVTYDKNSRVAGITYPAGFTISYHYNKDGQVTEILSGSSMLASYAYDSAGRPSSRTLANGVITTYNYDTVDRLSQISVANSGTNLWAQSYGYDANNRVSYVINGTAGSVGNAYNYDATGELLGAAYSGSNANLGYGSISGAQSTGSWTYDAVGNRTLQVSGSVSTSYTSNNVNQYSVVGTVSPTYNSRGDLTSLQNWNYSYDAGGNIVQAQNVSSGTTTVQYARDAFGALSAKTVNGSERVFLSISNQMILESYNVVSGNYVSYIFEPGTDRPLAMIMKNGTTYYFHQDYQGSVAALTDESGAIYQSYSYDAWGNPTAFNSSETVIANSEISSPWLFTGRYFDEMTGLYNYRARAYSPVLGRFMQMDPLDLGGGDPNIFRYCQNDPINLVDPSGLLGINDCPDFSLGGQGLQNSLTNQLNSLSSGNSNGNSSSSGTAGTGGKGGNSNGGPGGSAGNASGQGEGNGGLMGMLNALHDNTQGSIPMSPGNIASTLAVGLALASAGAAAPEEMIAVTHFTSAEAAGAIGEGGTLNAGSFVTTSDLSGMSASEVESTLEIDAGKGAYSTTFQTPASNLGPAFNGPTTSGGATQFQLNSATKVSTFLPTQ